MKQFILKHKRSFAGLAAALGIGIIMMSFQDSPFIPRQFGNNENFKDTLPEKNKGESMTMKEFDNLSEQLDKTMLEAAGTLERLDMGRLLKEVNQSIASIDMTKIMKDATDAVKSIDFEKIMQDVKSSLDNIDIDLEVEKALKDAKLEMEKAKVELSKIDSKAIEKELAEARLEIEKSKKELAKMDFSKIMDEAKAGISKAKAELKETRALFTEMEKDGLIDTKKGFKLEYKDKELYIDGKKQSADVTNKYRHYFKEDHFKITIEKE